jgi:hypothetical protein
MTATDAFAIETAQAGLQAAIAALAIAYKASADVRVESLVADMISAIEEGAADLNVIAGQIEDDRNADAPLRPWFSRYAAA